MESKFSVVIIFLLIACHCKGEDNEDLRGLLKQQQLKNNKQEEQLEQQQGQLEQQQEQLERQQEQLEEQQKELKHLKAIFSSFQSTNTPTGNGIGTMDKHNRRLLLDIDGHLPGQHKEGAMYIRWGRKSCPTNGTEMVYSGHAGGAFYSSTGGAAEYVCLPQDPIFGIQINVPSSAYMYGAEYETSYFGPAQDQNVPCVVCRSTTGVSSVMIPARNQCYQGWNREYHGRLASGHPSHNLASQFVCVDGQPELFTGGNLNEDGKLLYPVKAKCGSLNCPPYANDKELLCVVCTR